MQCALSEKLISEEAHTYNKERNGTGEKPIRTNGFIKPLKMKNIKQLIYRIYGGKKMNNCLRKTIVDILVILQANCCSQYKKLTQR